ncbi:MAG: immunoglobulin domain-containing protein [Defluviitaleaceae bacterium]|nr:immunoglobulin domain-containing protein [Defluviitaleaceae bacterium]
MKKKIHYSKRFFIPVHIMVAVIVSIIVAQFVSAQTEDEAANELRQRINYAWELLGETHVSESGADVPIIEYWATQEAHTELENAIAAAQSVLDFYVDYKNAPMISARNRHNVALKSDGTVWAWGNNSGGQLGDNSTTRRTTAVQVRTGTSTFLNNINTIAAGNRHTVALRNDGVVHAWGRNDDGQLGDGTTTRRLMAVQIQNFNNVAAVAAGSDHTLALQNNGSVWAWGDNTWLQIGRRNLASHAVFRRETSPMQVQHLSNVTAISAGSEHSLALGSDGAVIAWGRNYHGQFGIGTDNPLNSFMPRLVLDPDIDDIFWLFLHPQRFRIFSLPNILQFGSHAQGYSQLPAQTITIINYSSTSIVLNPLPTVEHWTLEAGENWTMTMLPGEMRTFTIRPNNGLVVPPSNPPNEIHTARDFRPIITISGSNGVFTRISPEFTVTASTTGIPTITVQPSSVTVSSGQNASFSVVASGNPSPTFQWQVSTNAGVSWSNISGATSSMLTIQNAGVGHNGNRYRIVVTNSHGTVTSNAAILTVGQPTPINIIGSTQLVRGQNEWSRINLQGSTGREIRVNWSSLSNADGSVSVFCSVLGRIRNERIEVRSLNFQTLPGRTYEVQFFINNSAFFETFNYYIVSVD